MKSYARLVLMATFAVFMLTVFAAADTPGAHPMYVRAIGDLRRARTHLNDGTSTGNPQADALVGRAADEVNKAIRDMVEASYTDGKDFNYNPPPDVDSIHAGRLHHIMDILDAAYRDVNMPESDPRAVGVQQRALHHLDEARRAMAEAIRIMNH
jgi:hypothetical protein